MKYINRGKYYFQLNLVENFVSIIIIIKKSCVMKKFCLILETIVTLLGMFLGDIITFVFNVLFFMVLIIQVPFALLISKILDSTGWALSVLQVELFFKIVVLFEKFPWILINSLYKYLLVYFPNQFLLVI